VNVGVLASGEGTNLQALLDSVHGHEVTITAVASDKPAAPALARAEKVGVPTAVFTVADHADRVARDVAIAGWLEQHEVDLVVLAGYMAILSPEFLARFPDRVINVHPSLLPAFPGLDAIGQAIDAGAKTFGVTVHFVDQGVDTGPVILQDSIELDEPGSEDQVHRLLRPIEHRLLADAVRRIASGG
jgi:phosphoribosylglycinamide formyltransferase-1